MSQKIILLKIAILSFTHLHIIPRLCDFSFCTVCKPQKEMFKQDVHATKAYGEHGMSKSKNDKKKKKKDHNKKSIQICALYSKSYNSFILKVDAI